jgi:hypothetical protein
MSTGAPMSRSDRRGPDIALFSELGPVGVGLTACEAAAHESVIGRIRAHGSRHGSVCRNRCRLGKGITDARRKLLAKSAIADNAFPLVATLEAMRVTRRCGAKCCGRRGQTE